MPRCGLPHPKHVNSTCTMRPGHKGSHQVYWRDSLHSWHETPMPADLAAFQPANSGK